MNLIRLSHDGCRSRRFDCNTASLTSGDEVDCLRVAICRTLVRCYWCISILVIIPVVRWCSLIGPYRSAVVLFDRGYGSFGNFDSTIPIDAVGMKSYMDSFFDPATLDCIRRSVQVVRIVKLSWPKL